MKVTMQEIINAFEAYGKALEDIGYERTSDPTLPERIQQHGIAVEYTPMTDDERTKIFCGHEGDVYESLEAFEQAVLARLGVAPTEIGDAVQEAELQDDHTQAAAPDIQQRMDLEQAKAICEQAGFAVVSVNYSGTTGSISIFGLRDAMDRIAAKEVK